MRRIAQAELCVVCGDFSGLDRFYAEIQKDGTNFLTAAGIALWGAIGSDNELLFDEVLEDIAAYPSRYGSPEAKLAVEIATAWVNNLLRTQVRCPDWLFNFDLSSIPGEWRRQVTFLKVAWLERNGEYTAAAVLADVLLNLNLDKVGKGSAADVFLKMAKARICRDEGKMDESMRWCREVVESARTLGIVLPFLGMVLGPKSVLERALSAGLPNSWRRSRT